MNLDDFVLNGRCQHGRSIVDCSACLRDHDRDEDESFFEIERPAVDPWEKTRNAREEDE